jgi:hypothetical protein
MAPLSLLEALADLPDPRSRHGQRHPLRAILSLTVLAMLRGCKGPTAIAQFGRDHGAALAHALGFRRGKTPAPSCLSDLYRALDAAAFEAALSRWVAARTPPPAEGADKQSVSLDGKTLRGSRDGDAPGHHLVAAYAPLVEAVLAQVRVDAKTNEHKAALVLLGILPLRGRVVTGDAAFCQRDLCRQVVDDGGHYLIKVDDNQPTLKADIAAAFGPAFPPLRPAPGGRSARRGDDPGQARRPSRAAAAAGHDDAQRLSRLAGGGAGRAPGARGDRRR